MPDLPMSTLRECSWDSDNGVYLVDRDDEAINCDEIAEQYNARVGGIREPPKSVDAILVGPDGRCIFVEFKNRALDQRLSFEARRKAYDTLLILGDVRGVRIGETRVDSDFALVYSARKTLARNGAKPASRSEVSSTESFLGFSKKLAELAKTNFIERGMGTLKRYCFRDVFLWTEEEFQAELSRRMESVPDEASQDTL